MSKEAEGVRSERAVRGRAGRGARDQGLQDGCRADALLELASFFLHEQLLALRQGAQTTKCFHHRSTDVKGKQRAHVDVSACGQHWTLVTTFGGSRSAFTITAGH